MPWRSEIGMYRNSPMHPTRAAIISCLNRTFYCVTACTSDVDMHNYTLPNKNCRHRHFNNTAFLIC